MNRIWLMGVAAWLLVASPIHETLAEDLAAALAPEELDAASDAVDRGLEWLSTRQNEDGSFNGLVKGVAGPSARETSYVILAFLSRGHQPNQGRYGRQMSRAIDWLVSIQRPDGSFSQLPPGEFPISQSHPLSGLALSEVYGGTTGPQSERVGNAIRRGLAFTRSVQASPKKLPIFRGGWAYARSDGLQFYEGIASIRPTAWSLAFLRSASNAGFQVPQLWIDEGVEFVIRCYSPGPHIENYRRLPVRSNQATFSGRPPLPAGKVKEDLGLPSSGKFPYIWANFNTTAAGMWALALNGRRGDEMVRKAGDWLAEFPVPAQGTVNDFYFAAYISTEAMSQLGGKHWETYFPRVVRRLFPHQDLDGHWRLDRQWYSHRTSPEFNTAVAVICLTIPDQLLPIHQR